MKKIILVSPYSIAQNPRLLKEYEALKAHGYKVTVFHGEKDKWASNFKYNHQGDFKLVGGPIGSFYYFFTKVIHKILKPFLPLAYTYNRISWLLYIKVLFNKADLYIGHNLAALPIAVKGAKFHGAKCGFDAEDFHRQETGDDKTSVDFIQNSSLEDNYISKVDYFSAASPLIANAYKEIYPNLNPLVINNVFSKNFIPTSTSSAPTSGLKLFWFSQTLGKDRGLEGVIIALGKLNLPLASLTLLGMVRANDKAYFEALIQQQNLNLNAVKFLDPVKPSAVFEIASQHDLGLALEPGFSLNNNLALSNKLFTYVTSGIGIIASETPAQKQFLLKYPLLGRSFKLGDVDGLADIILYYHTNREDLLRAKLEANILAKEELSWEAESKKFLEIIKSILCIQKQTQPRTNKE